MGKIEKTNRLIPKKHYIYFICGILLLLLILGWTHYIKMAVESKELRNDRSQVYNSIKKLQQDNFYAYAPEKFKKEADTIREASKP